MMLGTNNATTFHDFYDVMHWNIIVGPRQVYFLSEHFRVKNYFSLRGTSSPSMKEWREIYTEKILQVTNVLVLIFKQ